MTRDLWAAWRRLVGVALGLSLGGMTLSWVLYLPGWITADRFVEALFGSLLVLAGGVLGASVWLVPQVRSYRKHLNSLGATPRAAEGWAGPVDAAGALRRSRTPSPNRLITSDLRSG